MQFDTELIHAAYDHNDHNRALMPPIYQNSMFAMHEIGEKIPFKYSRLANPTRKILEDTIATLEKGTHGFAFASGVAGIDAIFRTFLQPNDTLVAVSDIYGGSYDLLTQVYASWGVNVIFADLTQPEKLDEIFAQHQVKNVVVGNTVQSAFTFGGHSKRWRKKAKAHGALVGVDNTFATPYLQNPLTMGCDIVFHSATKYLGGHSDVLIGVAAVNDEKLANSLNNMLIMTGAIAAPMDCWLVLRGIKTLAVRMERHCQNARELAIRLQQHPAIEKVFYPALPEHEHHELAKRQMRDFGGVVSVYLKNDTLEAANIVIQKHEINSYGIQFGWSGKLGQSQLHAIA